MSDGLMAMAEHGQPAVDHAVHADGRDDARDAGRSARPAERGGAGRHRAHAARPVRRARRLRRVHVERRHAQRRAGVRHAREREAPRSRAGQLARRYGLPYRASNASASNALDAQAAYESQMSLWSAVLGGAHLVYHGAGWMEGGLTASFEKLVLDVEMLQMMAVTIAPAVESTSARSTTASPRSPTFRRAGTSSALRIRSRATRPRSTSRSSRTGRTTRAGRRPGP